jgi:hypothetical protein
MPQSAMFEHWRASLRPVARRQLFAHLSPQVLGQDRGHVRQVDKCAVVLALAHHAGRQQRLPQIRRTPLRFPPGSRDAPVRQVPTDGVEGFVGHQAQRNVVQQLRLAGNNGTPICGVAEGAHVG